MSIRSIMTPEVARVSPDDPCTEAARLMEACDCGLIPVANGDSLVGVITDRDLALRLVAKGKPTDTRVGEIMTDKLLYCYEDHDIDEVARNMAEQQVRRLPVVSRDKRLVGIVSLGDISLAATREGGQALTGISQPNGDARPHA